MTVLVDDHLLRDWIVGPDPTLRHVVGRSDVATTNLWNVRLCRAAALQSASGALLAPLGSESRRALVGGLMALPTTISVAPMQQLAWRMGTLVSTFSGLSALGAEAVAAAETMNARILVSSRDVGPGLQKCCETLGVRYEVVER